MSDIPVTIPSHALAAVEALRRRLDAVAPSKYVVGIGMKETAGRFEDRLAVFVYVDEKRPSEQVPEAERIPAEVNGYVTDVVVFRPVLVTDVNRYDPMRGGIQISRPVPGQSRARHGGVRHARLRRPAPERPAAVAVDVRACRRRRESEDVSTGPRRDRGAGIGTAADLRTAGSPLIHDVAVIEPNTLRGLQTTVDGIGPIKGVAADAASTLNTAVKKRGTRTLLTAGRVKCLIPGGIPAISLLEISSEPAGQLFAGKPG